jgi:peptidyl-prolyl cis-trans isomerase C
MLFAAIPMAGCGGESVDQKPQGEALVKVGDKLITQQTLDEELALVPPFQRREFETPEGKQKLLDRLVEMELLYLAAVDMKMDKSDSLKAEFERARRQILMRHYYKDQIESAATPSDEDIQRYYDENQKDFEVKERVHGRLILCQDETAAKAIVKRVGQGEDFAALAKTESTDGATAAEEGDLGWFTRDGYVRSIGVNEELTGKLFDLDAGMVSPPIEVKGKGWAVVKVEEKEPAGLKGLAEVKDEIGRRLGPKIKEDHYRKSLEELKQRYKVEYFQAQPQAASTPEELFQLAQDSKDPLKRIEYYQQVVDRFGDSEQADRAMFMVGFVYSEELQDKEKAKAAFDRFIERYPQSDLIESARYMMKAMEGQEPEFQTD